MARNCSKQVHSEVLRDVLEQFQHPCLPLRGSRDDFLVAFRAGLAAISSVYGCDQEARTLDTFANTKSGGTVGMLPRAGLGWAGLAGWAGWLGLAGWARGVI